MSRWLCDALESATLVLVFSLAGCGDSAKLEPLAVDATVLAFGDSLTSGVGVGVEQSYPAVLARQLGLNVVNAGLPGEISADGRVRLAAMLEQHKPNLVLICHGGNDFLRGLPLGETEKNLRYMVAQAQSYGVGVVLIGVPKLGIWGKTPDIYARIAEDFKIPLDDKTLGELETDPAMKSDPVHLNDRGYQKLAEGITVLLKKSGAIAR